MSLCSTRRRSKPEAAYSRLSGGDLDDLADDAKVQSLSAPRSVVVSSRDDSPGTANGTRHIQHHIGGRDQVARAVGVGRAMRGAPRRGACDPPDEAAQPMRCPPSPRRRGSPTVPGSRCGCLRDRRGPRPRACLSAQSGAASPSPACARHPRPASSESTGRRPPASPQGPGGRSGSRRCSGRRRCRRCPGSPGPSGRRPGWRYGTSGVPIAMPCSRVNCVPSDPAQRAESAR